nr:unnamed protein product [Spirometra erinaceieuropaei]
MNEMHPPRYLIRVVLLALEVLVERFDCWILLDWGEEGDFCVPAARTAILINVWRAQLEKHKVLVATAGVFRDVLNHRKVSLNDVCLLVFDECHHADPDTNSDFTDICQHLQTFPSGRWRPDYSRGPKVLGLTASVVNNVKQGTPLDTKLRHLEALMRARLITSEDSSIAAVMGKREQSIIPFLSGGSQTRAGESYFQVYQALAEGVKTLSSVSPSSLPDFIDLQSLFDSNRRIRKDEFLSVMQFEDANPKKFKRTIQQCMRVMEEFGPWCADMASMSTGEQLGVLDGFRKGAFNVLVATDVIEEGLDVRACNVVIKVDPVTNFRSFIQSQGRARAAHSHYVLMTEDKMKCQVTVESFRRLEKELTAALRDRCVDTEEDEDVSDSAFKIAKLSYKPFGADGPRITPSSAGSVLMRYVSTLKTDASYVLKILYSQKKISLGGYQVQMLLPPPCPLQEIITGPIASTPEMAKSLARVAACRRLHEAGKCLNPLFPSLRT